MSDKRNTEIFTIFDEGESYDYSGPEKELLLAILTAALADLKVPGKEAKKAMEYLLNPEEDYIFSFRSICNFLNIDPQEILCYVGLKRMKKSGYHSGTNIN